MIETFCIFKNCRNKKQKYDADDKRKMKVNCILFPFSWEKITNPDPKCIYTQFGGPVKNAIIVHMYRRYIFQINIFPFFCINEILRSCQAYYIECPHQNRKS